jgi:hypothetical protein
VHRRNRRYHDTVVINGRSARASPRKYASLYRCSLSTYLSLSSMHHIITKSTGQIYRQDQRAHRCHTQHETGAALATEGHTRRKPGLIRRCCPAAIVDDKNKLNQIRKMNADRSQIKITIPTVAQYDASKCGD